MTPTGVFIFLYISCLLDGSLQQKYKVPEASVELLYPSGFSVSIPGKCCTTTYHPKPNTLLFDELCTSSISIKLHVNNRKLTHIRGLCYSFYYMFIRKDEEAIRLFAFHGKINEEFESRTDDEYFSRVIISAKDNKWTFTDKSTKFKLGDTINYWLFVDFHDGGNQMGYVSEFRKFAVSECPRNIVDENGFCNTPAPLKLEAPNPSIEILQRIEKKYVYLVVKAHSRTSMLVDLGLTPRSTIYIVIQECIAFTTRYTKKEGFTYTLSKTTIFINRTGNNYINSLRTDKTDIVKIGTGSLRLEITQGSTMRVNPERDSSIELECRCEATSSNHCTQSVTVWKGQVVCSGQLLLDEQFEYLNTNNWTREITYADDPDYEFVIYDKYEENLYIRNGKLHIKPTLVDDKYGKEFIFSTNEYDLGPSCTSNIAYNCKRKCTGGYALPPIFSARIGSNDFFKYGHVEIRAKFPKGDWIYPQLFLTPKNNEYGSNDYNSGEIRIGLVSGNANLNGDLQGMISLGTSPTAREFGISRLKRFNEGWSDNYHIYAILWKPDSLTFMVDNTEFAKIDPPEGGFSNTFLKEKPEVAAKWQLGSNMAPFDKEMFIRLGVGVGGHSFPDTIPGKMYTNSEAKPHVKFHRKKDVWIPTWTQESELVIDYVKIFAL